MLLIKTGKWIGIADFSNSSIKFEFFYPYFQEQIGHAGPEKYISRIRNDSINPRVSLAHWTAKDAMKRLTK